MEGNQVTSTGKKKHTLELQSLDGLANEASVTMWEDHPDFATVTLGDTLEGDVVKKQNGQYINKTIYPVRTQSPAKRNFGAPRGIAQAMERKEKSIQTFTENKEESIKLSSSFRMAVEIVTARGIEGWDRDVVQKEIEHWREWFWFNWEKPTTDYPPFANK